MVIERLNPDARVANCLQREHVERYVFASSYSRDLDVLDVACGIGYGTRHLRRFARRVVGGDVSLEAVGWAKRMFSEKADFVMMNAETMPFSDASFDTIVSFETIEHLYDVDKFLVECSRVLKPDGTFVCSTPNRDCPLHRPANPYHVREFNVSELSELLNKHMNEVVFYGQNAISRFDVMKSTLLRVGSRMLSLSPSNMQSWIRQVVTTHLLGDYAQVTVGKDTLAIDWLEGNEHMSSISKLDDIPKGAYPVKLLAVARR